MNERIKELAEQAEDYSYTEYAKKQTGYTREDFFKSKFAELIVRECINTIQNKSMNSGDEWENGLRIAECAIQEHFGVSE